MTGILEEVIAQIYAIAQVYGLQSRRAEDRVRLGDLLEILTRVATGSTTVHHLPPAPEAPGTALALARDEAVPLALALNELLTNAHKHNDRSEPTRPIRVVLETGATEQRVAIRNGPAGLPVGFDFAAGRGLGTGLELVRTLLPLQGATLTYRQEADEVVAELFLTPPTVYPVADPS